MDAATGRAPQALAGFERALAADARLVIDAFAIGSERQRLSRLDESLFRAGQLLSLVLRDFQGDRGAVRLAADQVLSRKGLVADALALQRGASPSEAPGLQAEFQQLAELRARIARDAMAGPGPEGPRVHRERLADATRQAEDLEIRLARQAPDAGPDALLWPDVTSRIARSIPPTAALIEFVCYSSFDFHPARPEEKKNRQTRRYAAFVLLHGDPEHPRLFDLGEAAVIDRAVAVFRHAITGEAGTLQEGRDEGAVTGIAGPGPGSGRHLNFSGPARQAGTSGDIRDAGRPLFQMVFAPLLEALGGRTRLFLSPDGELNRLPFEVLPLDGGRWMIDDYFISYLAVGRDVVRLGVAAAVPPSASLVLADPDYDLGGPVPHPSGPGPRVSFDRLPGTLREGGAIARLLGVEPVTGASAVESRLKACRSPLILHLATHGFVVDYKPVPALDSSELKEGSVVALDPHRRMIGLADHEGPPQDEETPAERHFVIATPSHFFDPAQEDRFVRLSGQELSNPLTRSGLALAGANTWLSGGAVPAEAEDGILNAEDVTGMELGGTELVVLSACESGLGEVHAGEGVFGLRRAFVLAGARTLVMSLWKVPDEPTRELMEGLYRRLLAGQGRADALREARLTVRSRYPDPYYWGAFICQGDPGPLPSIRRLG